MPIEQAMPSFEQGDIVRVPFPYTDRSVRQFRPALVASRGTVGENGTLLWVVMITSAENRQWPDDIVVRGAFAQTGLPVPSIIRSCKVATIEARQAERIGAIEQSVMCEVLRVMTIYLGVSSETPRTPPTE